MISAAKIRKITEKSNRKYFEQALAKVNQQILSAAKEGKYSVDVNVSCIDDYTKDWSCDEIAILCDMLEGFGYVIQKIRDKRTYTNYNGTYHIITILW
jgi:hypothetical protein